MSIKSKGDCYGSRFTLSYKTQRRICWIEDLIVIAQKSGIETIAITDHDCLAGTVRGQVIGKRYGVNVIREWNFPHLIIMQAKRFIFFAILPILRTGLRGFASVLRLHVKEQVR